MTMGMNKPHRTFAERSYEPMSRGGSIMTVLVIYAIAGAIMFAVWWFR